MKTTRNLTFVFVFIFTSGLFAQDIPKEYYELVRKADSLYNAKDYKNSTKTYSAAFKVNGWKGAPLDRYNAACSAALANIPDTAFFYLERSIKGGYTNYKHISTDSDLAILHEDKRWKTILEKVKENKDKAEAKFNKPIVKILDSIFIEDQKYRLELEELENDKILSLEAKAKKKDELAHKGMVADGRNLQKVRAILDKYGWLGPDEIGEQGNATLFLVIQHSYATVQEKYLPMMREAVKNKKAHPWDLALLEDRILISNGKKQIYGSQLEEDGLGGYKLSPIEDEANLNKRRAEVGLEPIEEYLKHWNIEYKYDPGKYEEENSFWKEHSFLFFLCGVVILYLLVLLIMFKWFKVDLFRSAWFWLFSIILLLSCYGWYCDTANGSRFNSYKWHLYNFTGFFVLMLLIFLINFVISYFAKRKYLVIELIALNLGIFIMMQYLSIIIYNLFYPGGLMSFYLNILAFIIPSIIFLLIKLIIYLLNKRKPASLNL